MTLSNISHGANLRLPLDMQNTERPSASGAWPPDSPTGGSAPLEGSYRFALRAGHGSY